MDFQLQKIKRQLATGEIQSSSQLKRVCPYSQKSVRLALKMLNAKPWSGGIIGVYLAAKGWSVKVLGTYQDPHTPTHHQATPPLSYRRLGYRLDWIQWNLADYWGGYRVKDINDNFVVNPKRGTLWHQRQSFSGAVGSWVKKVEEHLTKWARRRAQFAWYYGLNDVEQVQ